MKEPRSKRRHRRAVKIEMNKGTRFRTAMLLQKISEILIAEVMKNAGRNENGRGLVEAKGVLNCKLTTKVLDRCQLRSLVDQRDIKINAHQFNIVAERA